MKLWTFRVNGAALSFLAIKEVDAFREAERFAEGGTVLFDEAQTRIERKALRNIEGAKSLPNIDEKDIA